MVTHSCTIADLQGIVPETWPVHAWVRSDHFCLSDPVTFVDYYQDDLNTDFYYLFLREGAEEEVRVMLH
jgi:hypothetical protein